MGVIKQLGGNNHVDNIRGHDSGLVVAIPTTGRADIVADTIRAIADQDLHPARVIVSIAAECDINTDRLAGLPFEVTVVRAVRRGLPAQRNAAIEAARDAELMLFLDDDFLMSPDYLCQIRRIFDASSDVAMITGTVLADGIGGAGFDHAESRRLLSERQERRPRGDRLFDTNNGYGCNMAIRLAPVFAHDLRFDEALPLYAWLEDVDFSRQLARFGRIVRAEAATGVHQGTKTGRSRGMPLGYSQVANPIYLVGKGTMRRRHAARMILKNMLANTARSARPEPWVDRRGRLAGNFLALCDIARRRAAPGRVLDL